MGLKITSKSPLAEAKIMVDMTKPKYTLLKINGVMAKRKKPAVATRGVARIKGRKPYLSAALENIRSQATWVIKFIKVKNPNCSKEILYISLKVRNKIGVMLTVAA